LKIFCNRGCSSAIVNTAASGKAVKLLAASGVRTIALVHELPKILREKGLESAARAMIGHADQVVFASAFVREELAKALQFDPADQRLLIRPQGSYAQMERSPTEGAAFRKELGLGVADKLVLGVGYADLRKGFDLFLQTWSFVRQHHPDVHFCWVGDIDPGLFEWLGPEIKRAEATGHFHLVGFRSNVQALYSASSILALTSREDPFPTVVLEALSVGLPVVAFQDSGGIPEFLIKERVGVVVPYCDLPAMARAIEQIIRKEPSSSDRARMMEIIEVQFSFPDYVRDLVRIALPSLPTISVAVPNYNYAHCLTDRLVTVFDQDHPVEEIIVLDDASSDDSVSVVFKIAEERQRDLSLVINEKNSGSVFAQWRKAAEMATGEFLWIAEADDLSEVTFISSLLRLMESQPSIALGFTDSKSIDAGGECIYESYKPYFSTIEVDALSRTEVFDGSDFAARYLSVKNTILNVSGVLWRRHALLRSLDACQDDLANLRMAGDWLVYLECLADPGAKIAYIADPLNIHRRHAASVTQSLKAQVHLSEIEHMHGVARRRFRLSERETALQATYMDEVRAQLLTASTEGDKPKRIPKSPLRASNKA
jgi:glycosyltransferase involved in cell wall biosynthesis